VVAISKVLIANRGEIAVRIIRAAHDAGINTVAVYADQDRNARFARLAHEAYALNGNTSAETYLVPEKILSIAKRSGANAIHPGVMGSSLRTLILPKWSLMQGSSGLVPRLRHQITG